MASSLGNINAHAMRTGNLTANDWNKLSQANGVLGSADLRILTAQALRLMKYGQRSEK